MFLTCYNNKKENINEYLKNIDLETIFRNILLEMTKQLILRKITFYHPKLYHRLHFRP